jgi:hypothetical protein
LPATSFTAGSFITGPGGLNTWLVSDTNLVNVNQANQAVLHESRRDSETTLFQDFVIPVGANTLSFTIDGTTFDSLVRSGVTPDAFGVALLDPTTMEPLNDAANIRTDAYYIQDVVQNVLAREVGTGALVSLPDSTGARQVTLDVSGLGGQSARLLFRLIAGSDGTQLNGSVAISNVFLTGPGIPTGGVGTGQGIGGNPGSGSSSSGSSGNQGNGGVQGGNTQESSGAIVSVIVNSPGASNETTTTTQVHMSPTTDQGTTERYD